jgi:Asp-tRNA(Asn)/Glu-tRNA(Gln) amidotransferase A subunit family amidase
VIRNAWDRNLNPGGSSSGAPGSVLTGVAPIAVGTDMIGSVRLPAALSGLASIKPTQGRIAYDPAGDYRSAGPMARTVDEVEQALAVLGQHDHVDQFALPGRYEPQPPLQHLRGRKVGVLRALGWGTPVDEATARAVDTQASVLADLGAEVSEIGELPVGAADYQAIYWFMIYHGLPDYLAAEPARRARIQPEIGAMLEEAFAHSAVRSALDARQMAAATERVRAVFAPFDHVLSPALPIHAFGAEQLAPDPHDPVGHMGFATWPNRLAAPAGTVPVLELPAGPPVSVQISGRRFDDSGVLGVLRLLEQARGFQVH